MIIPINETCFVPKFYIRVIYVNGTVETSTQIYPIPEFNFCQIKTIDGNRFTLMIIRILPKYGVLVYTNSTNVNSSATYGILLSIIFMEAYINTHITIHAGFTPELQKEWEKREFKYKQARENENGEITKLKTGTIVQALLEDENYLSIDCFPALNNGFGIAIANTTITKNNNSAKNHKPNQPSTFIYVSLIYPNEVVEQFLIYQSADVNLKIEMMRCGTGYTIIGYRCALKLSKIENYWMRILFSSNGAVKSVKPLEFDQFQNSLLLIPNPLYYGGFLVSSISQSETYKNKSTITVYLLDDDLKINSTLDLPNNLTISSFLPEHLNFGMLLHNNTFVAIIPNENDNKNWQLISTEGTNLFNLDSTNKSEFNENLEKELANIIPINPIRLKLIQTQMDYSISPPALLLLFKINDSGDSQEINGSNIVILKFFLILTDFILDILFIINNGKNIPQLFIPSMVILILSIIFNSISSIFIVIKEISNNQEFYEWFKKYVNILAIFTVISSTEVDTLLILSSKIAGLNPFFAPFSSTSLSLIFWCSFVNFFIEDIPQFIIQVIYINSTISYGIIPFLTLITSSITIANNIITRLYNLIINIKKDKKAPLSPPIGNHSTVIIEDIDG
ncbi:17296_t:CDS:2 [Entrophospora sp. SA101]|nr:17296_t:CDS:2 [Entrophospora sp. SA101]